MLDRVDAGLGCPQNALRAMGVRGHLAAQAVRVGDDGRISSSVYCEACGSSPFDKHAAGGADLD